MKLATLALTTGVSALCAASAHAGSCPAPDTRIYFVNGINTSFEDALLTTQRVAREVEPGLEALRDRSHGFADETYTVKLAYNDTFGLLDDLAETLLQKAFEGSLFDPSLDARDMMAMAGSGLGAGELQELVRAGDLASAPLETAARMDERLVSDMGAAYATGVVDLLLRLVVTEAIHGFAFQSDLEAGRRVIALGYSQGNLFANTVVAQVRAAQPARAASISVSGVASPAALTVPGADYVTAQDDVVINSLRLLAGVLPANLDNAPRTGLDPREPLRHLFTESYFNPALDSRERIDSDLERLARTLPHPEPSPFNRFLAALAGCG